MLLLLVLSVGLCSCSPETTASGVVPTKEDWETDTVAQATLARYRESEIREYQGFRLDPAIGPRDNSIKGIQQVDMATYQLTVDGLVGQPLKLLYDEVLKMPAAERKITLYCVEGWQAVILWKGVPLVKLLEPASPKPEANTVIFHCYDGYTTSLPLSTIIDNQLILAYHSNGLPLPASMGYPFIFVAEDKLGYKWARWVTRIELSSDPSYKGYWESLGYDNEADVE